MTLDEAFALGFEAVKSYVDDGFGRFEARLKALEDRPGPKDGEDGKSVTVDDVTPLIAAELHKAVSAIPTPKDGEDGKSVTVDEVAPLIAAELHKAVSAIPVPKDGEDGKSVTVDEVAPLIAAEVHKALSAIPVPKDGEDGKSVSVDEVALLIAAEVQKAVSAIPVPKDGEDGKSVSVNEVAPLIAAEVQKALASIPAPKGGEDGKSVTVDEVAPLVVAEVQKAVSAIPVPKDGQDGKNGLGLKEALIDAEGELVLTFDDGTIKRPGRVKGDAGCNGFELKDFDAVLSEDGRTVMLSFDGGDIRHEVELAIPAAIYRGYYRDGETYACGDMVTIAGSVWHCGVEATAEKPGEGSKDWTLAVKRGRDGKDLRTPDLNKSVKVTLGDKS